MAAITMKPIKKMAVTFWIRGTSPLITHNWDEKAKAMMREKHAGKKTKTREKRDPQAEAMAACYTTRDGKYAIPGLGLKASFITAAHRDIGIERTMVRKAIFLATDDPNKLLELEAGDPTIREDMVRVGQGSADLRYRPMWEQWRVKVTLHIDGELLTPDDVATLVNRAGFGVGLCEWRPEKDGEFGRFEIDASEPFEVEEI